MKRFLCMLSLAVVTLSTTAYPSTASDVLPGDSKAHVLETLGEPEGRIGSRKFEIYYFDRGEVAFADGIVQSHSLISAEELMEREREAEAQRLAEVQKAKEARAERHAEGLALRDKALNNPVFATLPAEKRLSFWRSLRLNYPDVDVEFEYLLTLRQVEAEREAEAARLAEVRRAAETTARLRELEERVAEAEKEAELARRRSYDHDWGYHYPHGSPVIIVRKEQDHDRHDGGHDGDGHHDHGHGDDKSNHSDRPIEEGPRSQMSVRTEARQKAMNYMAAARQGVFHSSSALRQQAETERLERARGSIYLR